MNELNMQSSFDSLNLVFRSSKNLVRFVPPFIFSIKFGVLRCVFKQIRVQNLTGTGHPTGHLIWSLSKEHSG